MKNGKYASTWHELGALLVMGLVLFVGPVVNFSDNLSWHDQQRIAQVGLLAVMAVAIWRQNTRAFAPPLPGWAMMTLAGAFGWGLTSVLTAAHPRFAALEWATLLLLCGTAMLLAAQSLRESSAFDVWARRLVVSLAVVMALKVMTGYWVALHVIKHLDTTELFGGVFSNRRFFGQVASMLVPLLAYPLLRGGLSRRTQAALLALLALWWMLVIASGTRGTWMALAVAALVLAVFALRACTGWLRVQAVALGTGALLFAVLFVWLPAWLGLDVALENRMSNIADLNGRGELWAIAWAQVQAHPWLGIGPMHLAAIPIRFGAHPHNAPLQLAAEWGVPAAVLLLSTAALGLLHLLVRLRQQTTSPLLVCLTASLLAACAQSMVDGVIVMPYTQTFLAFVAGWTLGVYFRGEGQINVVHDSRLRRLGVSVLSMLALAALLNGVFPEGGRRVEATQAFTNAGNHILPRYWFVGRIP